jgi:CHAT domain-containing protein
LLALTLGAGRCRLHRLGAADTVSARIEEAHFGLRRLALADGADRSVRLVREATAAAGRALNATLLTPLRRELGDSPAVIVPTGLLHAVPWSLLPDLAPRPFRVAPSAAAWLRAAQGGLTPPAAPAAPAAAGDGRQGVVLVAGPGLPAAPGEVRSLGRTYGGARILQGAAAGAGAVMAALDGAGLAHIAAHGRLRTDNPLFSALELADGPLTVYDLEGLGRAPRLVVLPACHSGAAAVRSGDELMGLATALLALGTRTVIAAVAPVNDAATTAFMERLHASLHAGAAPQAALAEARTAAAAGDPAAWAAAAAFTCFGG